MTVRAPAKWGLRGLAFGYLGLLLLAPVGMIFYKTFEHGLGPPVEAMTSPDAVHAIWLTPNTVLRGTAIATISSVSQIAWTASGLVIASTGRPEAVFEGLVEDHPDRGEQKQAEVAEGQPAQPPFGRGADGHAVLPRRLVQRMKRLTAISSSSEIPSRTTETAAAPETLPDSI